MPKFSGANSKRHHVTDMDQRIPHLNTYPTFFTVFLVCQQKKRLQKIWQNKKNALHLHRKKRQRATNDGAIAQLVEQRTENPCVTGSIPVGTTNLNFRRR